MVKGNQEPISDPARTVGRIWSLRLWGFQEPRLDLLVTCLTVLLLVWTRFGFLACGPWERDEVDFAHGLLAFDLTAHPHPPGFPLWMALGWLLLPLARDPLLSLQLLSAAASTASLWPLAAIGRRVAPPAVATAAAVAILFAPGVWFHAGRGFTSTPAAFFALLAAAIAIRGLDSQRQATAFTAAVTAAFLIRPVLLPTLTVLWLAGALAVRPRRVLLPGLKLGLAACLWSTLGLLLAHGDPAELGEAFGGHLRWHFARLAEANAEPGRYGLVAALGGPVPAALVGALAVVGLLVWWRRAGRATALAWLAVAAGAGGQLLLLQNPALPRYAVPLVLAAAPLLAAAAAPAGRAVGPVALLSLGLLWGVDTYPVMAELGSGKLPVWEGSSFAVEAAERHGLDVVADLESLPFASYRLTLDVHRGQDAESAVYLDPGDPFNLNPEVMPTRPYLFVSARPGGHLPPLFGRSWRWGQLSSELVPLTQDRYLEAEVGAGVPLPVHGWFPLELAPDGEPFLWAGPSAELMLPAMPPGAFLGLDIEPARGPEPVLVEVNRGAAAVIGGELGRQRLVLGSQLLASASANRLVLSRAASYGPGRGDERPLAVRVSRLAVGGGARPWNGPLATAEERSRLGVVVDTVAAPQPVASDGFFRWESFGGVAGRWTQPRASLVLPRLEPGTLDLAVWAPRPTSPALAISLDGRRVGPPLALLATPQHVQLLLDVTVPGPVRLELESAPQRARGTDPRQLGVVLGGVSLRPRDEHGVAWAIVPSPPDGRWELLEGPRGTYDAEPFGDRRGVWTRPSVRLRVPAGAGVLRLTAWAPRPTSPRLEVWLGDAMLAGPLDLPSAPTTIPLLLPADPTGEVTLELRAVPFVPRLAGLGNDSRKLGVVLGELAFSPATPALETPLLEEP